jgi:hypothetical protein
LRLLVGCILWKEHTKNNPHYLGAAPHYRFDRAFWTHSPSIEVARLHWGSAKLLLLRPPVQVTFQATKVKNTVSVLEGGGPGSQSLGLRPSRASGPRWAPPRELQGSNLAGRAQQGVLSAKATSTAEQPTRLALVHLPSTFRALKLPKTQGVFLISAAMM